MTNAEVLGQLLVRYAGPWSRYYAATVLRSFARAVDEEDSIRDPMPEDWAPAAGDLVDNAPPEGTGAWVQWATGKQSTAEASRLRGYLTRAARALDAAGVPATKLQHLDAMLAGNYTTVDLSAVATALRDARAAGGVGPMLPGTTYPSPAPQPGKPKKPSPVPAPGSLPALPSWTGPVPPLPPATSSSSTRSSSGNGAWLALFLLAMLVVDYKGTR